MEYTYAVLGAGRQGTASAYDMARWGDAKRVTLADRDLAIAEHAAHRVNQLIGSEVADASQVEVTDMAALERLLSGVDAFVSAVPYYYNLDITRVAVKVKASMCDLGGNTDIVRQQHAFNAEARNLGISIIPDCGQVPGLGSSLTVYTMGLLDEATDVYMWDGGIPQSPQPPFNYLLTFHVAGLTNEYAEPAIFLRNGKITLVEPMTELETVEFPDSVGTLEAFVAGGGTSTMPWTFEGKLRTLQNLTLRYPGHLKQLRSFWDLGLWDLKPVLVGKNEVVPREVFHALYEPKVTFPNDPEKSKDIVLVRVKALGKKGGQPAQAVVELVDRFDEMTGFTAMERTTGWDAAIVAEMMAHGLTPRGAGGVESFVPAVPFMNELRRRGFHIQEKVE
ncbi:MAG: saccharopine dehydrogenase C-terminal domain-containing protein [Anaerolineales bacterium]|jgi:lysine 6-dehydrogenase